MEYSDGFTRAISKNQLHSTLDRISSQLGMFREVRGDSNPYSVIFRRGTAKAVGSAFKLAVLAALNDAVSAGDVRWDDVVRVRDEWRSLPTGPMQEWPEGSAVTIENLAYSVSTSKEPQESRLPYQ